MTGFVKDGTDGPQSGDSESRPSLPGLRAAVITYEYTLNERVRTLLAEVAPALPVFIFYTTAIVRADDTVEFFDDLYGLDARLEKELAAAGAR